MIKNAMCLLMFDMPETHMSANYQQTVPLLEQQTETYKCDVQKQKHFRLQKPTIVVHFLLVFAMDDHISIHINPWNGKPLLQTGHFLRDLLCLRCSYQLMRWSARVKHSLCFVDKAACLKVALRTTEIKLHVKN